MSPHVPAFTGMPARLLAVAAAAATLMATPAVAADKVKVGLLSTLSGAGSGLGIDIRDGFQLAVKHSGGKLGGLPAEAIIPEEPGGSAPPPAPPAGNCEPSYPDVCIPLKSEVGDLDCPQIDESRFRVLPPDPHGFDGDGDGIGCEVT